jgi:ABC-type uncharacterized transport system involved in gliding motility auxiliary subunit
MEAVAPALGRFLRGRAAAALNVALACLVAAEAVFLGSRLYGRFDLTMGRTFTISERSVKILSALAKPVRATVFYGKDHPDQRWTWQKVMDLLEELGLHTRYLEVVHVDPYRKPAEAGQLRQKFGISENDFNEGVVVFEYGDRARTVADSRIVARTAPVPGVQRPDLEKKVFLGEEAFVSAIAALVEGRRPVAYFLLGHGESGPADGGQVGYQAASFLLQGDGYEVKELRFGPQSTAVPPDADIVFVAGPTSPLPNEHVYALRQYAERGGNLFLMATFPIRAGETTPVDLNLGPLLSHFGVRLGDRLVAEEPMQIVSAEAVQILNVDRYNPVHPATRAMGSGEEKRTGAFVSPRAVYPEREIAVPLAFSSRTSVEKGDLTEILDGRRFGDLWNYRRSIFNPEKDARGPFPLIVASEVPGKKPGEQSRAVVAGTQTFAANFALAGLPYNGDLFTNLANWLTSRETHMGIAGKPPHEVSYHVRPSVARFVFWLVLAVMPLLALALGILVWLARRT